MAAVNPTILPAERSVPASISRPPVPRAIKSLVDVCDRMLIMFLGLVIKVMLQNR
ncbi:hypothetical protein HMPREF3200_00513 [Anaerococcus tetradius]|uniref:Uncharacterized protein n=1 Tax=Anaerococcus tetradius TaxID=33036 RepID=A0A133KH61_9FIRM|nr:hypothetical protein HMPREF3200_00513 [Anaerococcus tetradius]